MNIQIQLCGLFILILLYLFYKSSKTLHLYSEKIFHRTMCIAILSLSMDISSIIMIRFRNAVPMVLVNAVCKFYVITLVWMTMLAFSYVLTDLFAENIHKNIMKKILAVIGIQSIVVAIVPIHIYENGKQVYTYGPAVLCVYAFVAIYMISTVGVMCTCLKKLNKRRVLAVGLWMCIWIGAATIQFLYNELLVVGFAITAGVLILFVVMENPEVYIDRRVGCFNSYALSEYLKRLIESKQQFSVLEIVFEDFDLLEERGASIEKVMKKVLVLTRKHTDGILFKNIDSNLVIISSNTEQLQMLSEKILEEFEKNGMLHQDTMAILVIRGEAFSRMKELFHFLTFIRSWYANNDKTKVFLADEKIIRKYKEQSEMASKISEALSEDRVEVFLQPIYSNEEKCFTSAEALVRIREKDGTLLSPGTFIPIAESNGQIVELGDRVLEKVCEFLKNTDAVRLGLHYVEVNLSVVQCEMTDLAERLIRIVEKYQVDPKQINLEITETASISARAVLLENMKKLIDYGFTFSLDDFGKGESNLMYVVEMPVSIVKLDYDMSKAFFNSPKAQQVVRAVVNMAHGMDLKLVAEGIETQEEIDGMRKEGIDYIQGYYYAKPLPVGEFLQFLSEYRSKNFAANM